MKLVKCLLLACTAFSGGVAHAQDDQQEEGGRREIVVSGVKVESSAATKTDVPAIEVPQPVTVIPAEVYLAQGAISVSDTLNYVAGVQANPYGPDSRVDGSLVRGVNALQFRDGMRDIFSYYASIRADPYNFSQVELVRGPASVLFGSGSLGGIVNLVSKVPEFDAGGEVAVRYGSYDRKEATVDVTGPLSDRLAVRVVARVREGGSQTDYVPDDRVLFAPSITWAPSMDTDITLLGLYQEDDGGSTSQFLPLVGTIYDNPNGQLPNDLFIGKPGWDRYDGRLAQGTGILNHRFSENVKLSLKARYIDSDLTYLTHYPNNYSNPANPFILLDPVTGQPVLDPDTGARLPDPEMRHMGLYAEGSYAQMEVFSSDNNIRFDFNTGGAIRHMLLAGVDYSWSRVYKEGGFAEEFFDIYDIDYNALSDFGGGLPGTSYVAEDGRQEQLGFYLQDHIRFWDRVSVVLGVRHDNVTATSFGEKAFDDSATSFRAGIIADLLPGVSPFFSYTESFEPITGHASDGQPFKPQQGRQFEAGIKFHPDDATLATVTFYHIKQTNRPVEDPSTVDPFDQMQAGELTSKGFEVEAGRRLPGDYEIIANYSYNEATVDGSGVQLDDVPKVNASLWATKSIALGGEATLRLGAGVRYIGEHESASWAFPDPVVTPDVTLFDALAEVNWQKWSFALNATNLFDKRYYSACLGRGDCFMGSERNVFGTLSYRF